ncbi:uncharacterized protein V6R79_021850 [Siganus canaliculatus]
MCRAERQTLLCFPVCAAASQRHARFNYDSMAHAAKRSLQLASTSPPTGPFAFCVLQTCHSPSLSKSHLYHMPPVLYSSISAASPSSHCADMKQCPAGMLLQRNLDP